MMQWAELSELIRAESDPRTLHEKYQVQENFIILVTAGESQKGILEMMLETLQKTDEFEQNFVYCGVRRYSLNGAILDYWGKRCPGFVEWFERESGQSSDSNLAICFHSPHPANYATQVFAVKKAVLELSSKLVELKIPFETARPSSRYVPHVASS